MSLRRASIWLALGSASCTADTPRATAPEPPTIRHVIAGINPENALSLVVTAAAERADSIRIRYSSATDTAGVTPFYPTWGAPSARIAVVGLHASTSYRLEIEAIGLGGQVTSEAQFATTGDLPLAIRALQLSGTGRASPGFTLVVPLLADTSASADGFVVAFDEAGEIRWYRRFPGAWPVEAKQQLDGNITVFVGRTYGWQPNAGAFVEVTPAGDLVRSFSVAPGYYTDPHELLLSFHDGAVTATHLIGYEIRDFDLSAVGGPAHAPLAVHTIERHDAAGRVTFRWSAASLFTIDDWPLPNPRAVDLDHPSSLAIAPDGGYVVSFQGMDEIMKLDAVTGAVLWRLGGRHNQFDIRDDPLHGFLGQHSVRVLDNGDLLMLDDRFRGTPGPARAVEYSLDTQRMIARMVWEYRPSQTVISPIMGSVQRVASGGTLVGFGAAGRVDEVNADGTVAWSAVLRGEGPAPVPFYRALRLRSLYEASDGR